MFSVANIDYYMTEYLIKYGADPNCWQDREECIQNDMELGIEPNNYYLEDIDINLMDINISDKKESFNILRLVKILVENGKLDSFYGLCLEVNAEERKISIHALRLQY